MKTLDVLVADNSPIILEFMTEVLTSAGCRVRTAANGIEAFQMLNREPADILFTDIVMPYIDGLRLVRILRSRPRHKGLFISALSAIARESTMDLSTAGFDLCIAKGPLREMRPNVLAALEAGRRGRSDFTETRILGLETVHEREITRELLAEIAQYELLSDHLADGVVITTMDGTVLYLNRPAAAILATTDEVAVGEPFDELGLVLMPGENQVPEQFVGPDRGTLYTFRDRVLSCATVPVVEADRQSRFVILRDVTELWRSRRNLLAALDEKEILLREVHHRVKNNLATISSLISLQAAELHDPEGRDALEHLRAQISSIGLVHEKIYQNVGVAAVPFRAYATEILETVLDIHERADSVELLIDAVQIHFSTELAIPLGLILVELAINSLKHGFPKGRSGRISMSLRREGDMDWLIEYHDDGVGFSPESEPGKRSVLTLGMQLLSGLARQIRGSITRDREDPRRVFVAFTDPEASEAE